MDKGWQLLSVSLAAQITTLPVSLYYFHQFPIYFWLSSLVVIPAAGVILTLGMTLFIASFISASLTSIIGVVLGYLVTGVNSFIFLLESLPYNLIEEIWLSGTVAVLLYLLIFSLVITWQRRSFKWLNSGLLIITVLAVQQAVRHYQTHQQRQIVVYHVPRHSLVDCIDQRTAYSLRSDSLNKKQLNYAAQNYRSKIKIEEVAPVTITATRELNTSFFQLQPHIFRFYRQRIAIVDRPLSRTHPVTPVDYILVRNSPSISMADIEKHFGFKQIIFDGSNKLWQVKKWEKECAARGLNCYDTNQRGAWIKHLKK